MAMVKTGLLFNKFLPNVGNFGLRDRNICVQFGWLTFLTLNNTPNGIDFSSSNLSFIIFSEHANFFFIMSKNYNLFYIYGLPTSSSCSYFFCQSMWTSSNFIFDLILYFKKSEHADIFFFFFLPLKRWGSRGESHWTACSQWRP